MGGSGREVPRGHAPGEEERIGGGVGAEETSRPHRPRCRRDGRRCGCDAAPRSPAVDGALPGPPLEVVVCVILAFVVAVLDTAVPRGVLVVPTLPRRVNPGASVLGPASLFHRIRYSAASVSYRGVARRDKMTNKDET